MEVHLRDLFSRFEQQFGAGPGFGPSHKTCLLEVEGITAAFIKSLFSACSAFFRSDPWKRLRPSHLLGVRVGKDQRQPFPCAQLVGGDGGDLAVHLFRSEQDALRSTSALETRLIPNLEILRLLFLPLHLLPLSSQRMVKSLSLESSKTLFPSIDVAFSTADNRPRFRNPSMEELRFLFAFLKSASLIHALIQPSKSKPTAQILSPFIETVDVDFPPEISRGHVAHVAVTLSHPPGETQNLPKPFSSRQCFLCNNEAHDGTLTCPKCSAVIYCSASCQRQHWKDSHRDVCGLYKAMMEREEELAINVFFFPCELDDPCKWLDLLGVHHKGMWKRLCPCYSHCPFGLLNADTEFSPEPDRAGTFSLLSCWTEFYSLRSLPLSDPAAVILSHPLTVYYAVTAMAVDCKNRLAKGKEVVVHYLGPEAELDWAPAFGEIGRLVGSGRLEVFMVGPAVPAGKLSVKVNGVALTFVRGLYHEVCGGLPAPDAVVALNCGMEDSGEWGGALEAIAAIESPAFFTDRSEIACAAAKQAARSAGLHISHPVSPNPFRSPVRDRAPSHELPCYSNGFIFGVNT